MYQSVYKRYQKRPIVAEAMQMSLPIFIQTKEGLMYARPGDYLVRGFFGEPYPVSQGIFEETYDEAGECQYMKYWLVKELDGTYTIKLETV